ncbi:N-acetylmuramoyl-L-alanine amidase [Anaerovibrio sp. JC8]|uniref:N-acetylmuramoyl-L-alanine amidase family protein n=1 Tax=Anaerovibrio sp. JC8 TaxID=1240085 RepID=UPI000A11ADD4|nr:N-acetylmuramoyl-L-alanine amidase [Anaerovibrio sp. JC8]
MGFIGLGSVPAQAAVNHTLNYFHYNTFKDDDGRNWVRIEMGMNKGELEYEVSENPDRPYHLILTLKNTNRGDVKKNIGLDRKIARYMTLKNDHRDMVVTLAVTDSLSDHEYKVYTAEADRKAKKPYRLVIEVAADKGAQHKALGDESLEGVEGFTVVVDAGHGGSDTGAIGPSYVREKDVTLNIALDVARILEANGVNVVMTRTTDVDVYGPNATDKQELQARVNVSRRHPEADIFVSIHCNAFTNSSARGTGTYYYAHGYRDSLLAQQIQDEMVAATGLRDRGINQARFYVLRNSWIPATLVETAFISNPYEENMLASAEMQHTMALAICKGISNYFQSIGR